MSDTFTNLYDKFMGYIEREDEQGARNFLVENLQKFPDEVQEKITFAFFEEALKKETGDKNKIAQMQKQGLNALGQISKAKKVLEDKAREEDLRSSLTQ